MEKISYEMYQKIISYLENNDKNQEEIDFTNETLILILKALSSKGTKHVAALEKILREEGELSIDDIVRYSENITKFIEYHKFAPPLLVKEFPSERIEDFKQVTWQALTKTSVFKESDYEGKKTILKLGCVFGVFENDEESLSRTGSLLNMLQGKTQLDLECYKDLKMEYNPQFFKFITDNSKELDNIDLAQIQENWEKISRCVDIKTPQNIVRYMQTFEEKKSNEFETYMKYHNVSQSKIAKYAKLYDYMRGRTKTSMPTISGEVDKGFSYEMLGFDDIRVMRFGETIKCCQVLGGNAETSMINSAIEATSRVMMISDEKGKPIAGSLVTHKIDKDGRSYVCFDSIEVNASKLPVKAVAFSKTMKKIDKLVAKGVISSSSLEDIEEYFNTTPKQKHISEKDIKALRINKKIKDAYKAAINDMIYEDEKKRREQLDKGEITQEEYDHILIKNGRVTVGRNPVSMYLKDLTKVDKKQMELLPARVKDKSIYKKIHKITFFNSLKKIERGIGKVCIGMGTLMAATGAVAPGIVFVVLGTTIHIKLPNNAVDGVYSDATKEQRLFYDGRANYNSTIQDKSKLKEFEEKIKYNQYDTISIPIKVSELTQEQRKQFRRLREAVGQKDFTEQDNDKYVVGNGQNWGAVFTREGNKVIVNDISMLNSFGFSSKHKKLADAQIELLDALQTLAENSESISFKCSNDKVNRYLAKNIKIKKQSTQELTQVKKKDMETQERL